MRIGEVRQPLNRDILSEHLLQLVLSRLVDPLAIVLDSDEALAGPRADATRAAPGWARVLLGNDAQAATMLAVRLLAVLYSGDEVFEPPRHWWTSPLGRIVAWRLGHPSRRHVTYEVAGAMLGITRQGVGDLVRRGKLQRHTDGGVDVDSIKARIHRSMSDEE